MKKFFCVFVSFFVLFAALGCASRPTSAISTGKVAELPDFMEKAPESDTDIYGIGSARLNNQELARQTAESRARRAIADNLSIQVQGMLTDYSREAGTLKDVSSLQLVENIGRQVTDAKLTGVKIVKRERTKDGTWWVLASYPKNSAKTELAGVIENEASFYTDFKAQEALKMLDTQLNKPQSVITVGSD
ncbi:MAG: LPP20 family lipoprotein [Spirochaetaceae bacterium]|jgi:hypothetical protein|nr:LPP20 family lipoprotein [Spirochaetaceae bacterium]